MECSTHGFTLHHVPRNSGRTGGGVGVLINDRVKLVTRLEPINNAVSFESMEIILRIHETSSILGERISAIILTQQCKQWLSVELNPWRSERIH